MSWLEIGESIKARFGEGGVQANDAVPYFRRLTEIALFDRATSDDDRDRAASLATSLRQDIEAGLAHLPNALASFKEAADFHISQAANYGFGSLHWITETENVPASELVDFIVRPEYAQLLPAYLEMQSPEIMAKIRGAVLRALIESRREGEDQSSLQVLHGLTLATDPALPFLLTDDELTAIAKSTANFEASSAIVRLLIGD